MEKILGYKKTHYGCLKIQPHKGKCLHPKDVNKEYLIHKKGTNK